MFEHDFYDDDFYDNPFRKTQKQQNANKTMSYKEVMDYLKENGKTIGNESNEGNKLASEVISAYSFHYKCPGDPGGKCLLIVAVEKYIKAKNNGGN